MFNLRHVIVEFADTRKTRDGRGAGDEEVQRSCRRSLVSLPRHRRFFPLTRGLGLGFRVLGLRVKLRLTSRSLAAPRRQRWGG